MKIPILACVLSSAAFLVLLAPELSTAATPPSSQSTSTPADTQESTTIMTDLPIPLVRLVAAVNTGDTEAFLALFPADGVVDDWGRRFSGHDAIRIWSEKEFTGAMGTMTVQKMTRSGDTVTMDADWKSSFYSGDSRFVFILRGDRIRAMHIVSH